MKRYLDQKIKIRQLRAVAAIASHGSLLSAAQALSMTQPALTKTLRELEDTLGVRIFERHARGVFPNDHGRLVAEAAHQILNALSDLEEGFDRLEGRLAGSVVVGALPTAAAGVMPEVVRRLRASDPGISIRVIEDRTDELITLLILGEVDLVVGRLYPAGVDQDERLVRTPLYDEPMSLVVGAQHPLASAETITVEDLAGYDLSTPISSFRIHADTVAFLSAYGLSAEEGVTTTSLTLLRELLLTSTMIAVMPHLMLGGDVVRGAMKVLRLSPGRRSPPRPAGIIYRADRPLLPPARRLAAAIDDYCREILARAPA